jgi:[ribosomal protein S18]-alanine N-acetyltransferase
MGTMTRFDIRAMNGMDAASVAGWQYEPPYDFYNWSHFPDDLQELQDESRWGISLFAADLDGVLAGYLERTSVSGWAVSMGLGLRPDLTGLGLGRSFVEAILRFVAARGVREVQLEVASFNDRARLVYEDCGFRVTGSHVGVEGKTFIEMIREV